MSTRSIVGYVDRDGYGNASYVHDDGYPAGGVGETLMKHWQDWGKVRQLVDGGDMRSIAGRTELEEIEHYNDNDFYPVALTPDKPSFFDMDWQDIGDVRYVYLFTPDGWFGRASGRHGGQVVPILHMVEDLGL